MKNNNLVKASNNALINEANTLHVRNQSYRLADVVRLNAISVELKRRGFFVRQNQIIQGVDFSYIPWHP